LYSIGSATLLHSTTILSHTFITARTMNPIKQEHIEEEDGLDGLFTGPETYIPPNFEPDEWNNLIDVILTACYHVQD
jgi:hypothetical protein